MLYATVLFATAAVGTGLYYGYQYYKNYALEKSAEATVDYFFATDNVYIRNLKKYLDDNKLTDKLKDCLKKAYLDGYKKIIAGESIPVSKNPYVSTALDLIPIFIEDNRLSDENKKRLASFMLDRAAVLIQSTGQELWGVLGISEVGTNINKLNQGTSRVWEGLNDIWNKNYTQGICTLAEGVSMISEGANSLSPQISETVKIAKAIYRP